MDSNALKAANAVYTDMAVGAVSWVCDIASNGSVVCPAIYDDLPPPCSTVAELNALGSIMLVFGYGQFWRCAITRGTGLCWGLWVGDNTYPVPTNVGPVIALIIILKMYDVRLPRHPRLQALCMDQNATVTGSLMFHILRVPAS